MKKSESNTGTRLIAANCGDDYQVCPAAIVKIDKEIVVKWNDWNEMCSKLKEKYTEFVGAEFVGVDIEFLDSLADNENDSEYVENWADTLDAEGDMWVEDIQPDDYTIIDEKIWGNAVYVSGDGYISFKGQGKHSGIEYWTESIKLTEIL